MSLDERDERYRHDRIEKTINIWATEDDLVALKEVIDEANRMFGPDLVKDGDLPTRITISEDMDPEPVMYPRTASLLRKLSAALDQAASGQTNYPRVVVSDLPIFHARGTHGNDIIGLMETILHGKANNKGGLSRQKLNTMATDYLSVSTALEGLINNPELRDVMQKADFEWSYVQNLDTHMGAHMTAAQKASIKSMLEADKLRKDYPSDMGGYSQAYIAMLRSNTQISTDIPTQINKTDWETFLRNFNVAGTELGRKHKQPPKTMGDVLEFLFAYNVGRAFRFDNATVLPFAKHRAPIEGEWIKGVGAVQGGVDEFKGYKYMYKTIVAGTGPIRVPPRALQQRKGSVSALPLADVPGFFI